MATSTEQKKAIELGRLLAARLTKQTGDEQTVRWMAYYIAELITRAETASGEEKAAAEKACFDTILALWTQRHEFPQGHRPFEKFESIVATLTRIDPENPTPYYHHMLRRRAKTTDESDDITKCLDFIERVDHIARTLVSAALSSATTFATSPDTQAFLKAELGDDTSDQDSVAALISINHHDLTAAREQQLSEQIASLGQFVRLAGHLRADLEAKKAALAAKRTQKKDGPSATPDAE